MAHLHPGNLDVGDPGAHEEPGHCDDSQVFGRRGARARSEHVVELIALVDIAEGNELGEPVGLLLNIPDQSHVGGDMSGALDMAVHHCGTRGQADRVCGLDDLHPTGGVQLAGRQDIPDLVVEDLRRRSRQAADPRLHHPGQVIGEFHPALAMPPIDLLGRVGVEVQLRKGALDGRGQLVVVLVIFLRVNAALDADLAGAALDGFGAFLQDCLHVLNVGIGLMLMT